MLTLAAVLGCLIVSAPRAEAAPRYRVYAWRAPRDVAAVARAPDGSLWVGSRHELLHLRHPSSGGRTYTLDPGQPWPMAIAAGVDRVCVSLGDVPGGLRDPMDVPVAVGGGVWCGRPGAWERLPQFGTSTPVRALVTSRDGTMWGAAGKLGLVSIDARNGVRSHEPTPSDAFDVAVDGQDRLWVGGAKGLAVWGPDRVPREVDGEGPVPLVAAAEGRVLYARGGALWRIDHAGASARVADLPAGTQTLHLDPDGTGWIGTSAGLFRLGSEGDLRRLGEDEGLSSEDVRVVLGDAEENLWVGTRSAGLAQLRPQRVVNRRLADGAGPLRPTAVAARTGGGTWIATERGLYLDEGTGPRRVPEVPSGKLSALAEDGRGRLWMITAEAGLVVRGPRGEVSRRRTANAVRLASDRKSGAMHVASVDGDVRTFHQDAAADEDAVVRSPPAGCEGETRALAAARGGGVWLATRTGLARLDDGPTVPCMPLPTGLLPDTIETLHEDEAGRLWIGAASDGGVFVVDASTIGPAAGQSRRAKRFGLAQGLACDSIHEILTAGPHLWVVCGGGVQRLDLAAMASFDETTATRPLAPVLFTTEEDVMAVPTVRGGHPIAVLADGRLHVAGQFAVSSLELVDPPPPLARGPELLEVLVNGRPASLTQPLEVREPSVRLELRWGLATFAPATHLRFARRLEGQDAGWAMDDVSATYARYESLPVGRYRFVLAAGDGRGGWLPSAASFELGVLPEGRPWARALAALFALGAGMWTWHRFRLARAQKRHAAIHAERARIARELHDFLGQSLAAIGFQIDAARRTVRGVSDPAERLLAEARSVLDDARKQTRRAIWELRSSDTDTISLDRALAAVVERQRRAGDAGPELVLRIEAVPPRSTLLERELLAIAEEAIANARRHARASRVEVTLAMKEDAVVLTVTDDGVGIAAGPPPPGHYGIIGMHERAGRAGGDVRVEPRGSAQRGTEVTFEVPLSAWGGPGGPSA